MPARRKKAPPTKNFVEHTLYCIGGSLDGQVRTESGEHFLLLSMWECYIRTSYDVDGVIVFFWTSTTYFEREAIARAREMFVDAAVLRDEQLLYE